MVSQLGRHCYEEVFWNSMMPSVRSVLMPLNAQAIFSFTLNMCGNGGNECATGGAYLGSSPTPLKIGLCSVLAFVSQEMNFNSRTSMLNQ
ncbi:hypothetical protein Tsubulata_039685 [Turnera subulata]|uniref:Uncharacterized protein n=1 Tax=Turnera subulata TaxID=218843 RepID=A0A9Q0JBY2_9ROSI|nr:hypothetical protein Tsubulata_039685 [Turnera subulata]